MAELIVKDVALRLGDNEILKGVSISVPSGQVVALLGPYVQSLDRSQRLPALVMMTLITLVTQRPFEQMNADSYFRDWFPLYERPEGLSAAWSYRILATMLFGGALAALTSRLGGRSSQAIE